MSRKFSEALLRPNILQSTDDELILILKEAFEPKRESNFYHAQDEAMKRLYLVRHAQSSKEGAAFSDRDRPLSDPGRRALEKMAKRLAKRSVEPDLILSSPALRTLATAEGIAKKLDYDLKAIVVNERLYACQADEMLEIIRALDDTLKRVMLVGHNPQLFAMANHLSRKIKCLPTCAVAEFRFAIKSWAEVGEEKPEKTRLDYPKKAKG